MSDEQGRASTEGWSNAEIMERFSETHTIWWCDSCVELRLENPCQDCGRSVRVISVSEDHPS